MKQRAFSRVEVFVVVATLSLLLVVTFSISRPRAYGGRSRPTCINNLKQVGLAFGTWSTDNNGLFPMKYYTNSSGAMLFANSSNLFRNFKVMSNELNNPNILLCPDDKTRTMSDDFGSKFSGSNISYFVGLDVDETIPASILSGDRNITNGVPLGNGILNSTSSQPASWTMGEQHNGVGNILCSDGSVRPLVSMPELRARLAATGLATYRLGMP